MLGFIPIILIASAFLLGIFVLNERRSARKTLAEFKSRIEQAERVLKTRARLANEVAHEIKNPLTAILCSAETLDLLLGDKLPDEHRRSLKYIKEYGEVLLQLVSDFLDLNRVEGGQIQVHPEGCQLAQVLGGVLGILGPHAKQRSIDFQISSMPPNCSVLADPRHLRQILFNVVHNAIKFAPNRSRVEIECSVDKESIFINVIDRGPGIAKHLQEQLFNPEKRYENELPKQELLNVGSGIGLALSKRLIELNGGSIELISIPGKGTCITLAFNRYADNFKQTPMLEHRPLHKPLLGLSFLIVDSDSATRQSVASLLQAWGGVVEQVAEASQALLELSNRNFDAIMIDDRAESSSALELTKRIREQGDINSNPAVIVTGHTSEHKELVLKAGADAFIDKPFSGTALLESINQVKECH